MGLLTDNKQMAQKMVKNPDWWEVNQLPILQVWLRIRTREVTDPCSGYGKT